MGTFRKTFATMLMGLSMVAFMSDSYAQTRRSTDSRTENRQSARPQVNRSQTRKQQADKPQPNKSQATKPQTTRPQASKPQVNRSQTTRPQASKPQATKPQTTRPQASKPQVNRTPSNRPQQARPQVNKPQANKMPPARPHKGVQNHAGPKPVYRPHHNHHVPKIHHKPHYHFGYRVRILPSRARRYNYYGVNYYFYDNIWYRPYGGHYVVCRPPMGTVIAANLIADMAWTAVRLSYYNTVVKQYSQINENNSYITEQNKIIAENNAIIAAQNKQIAMNQNLASEAVTLADRLGLVQSYADAGTDYFYQDGVFYCENKDGDYYVVVPPAGSLIETLPEDYEDIVMDGNNYYKVDDTVYRVKLVDGKPLFEVLGQMIS